MSTSMPARRRSSASSRGRGVGIAQNCRDQPNAKQITHAPQPTLWSADAERVPVPVASDAEWPLQDARRTVTGRAEG